MRTRPSRTSSSCSALLPELALSLELAKLLELGLRAFEAFGPRAYEGDYRAFEPTLLLALAMLPKLAKLLELGPDAYEGDNEAHRL